MGFLSKDCETIWGRTRHARIQAGIGNAKEMVDKFALHGVVVSEAAYYKYETRSKIRHDLVATFCEITKINQHWLLTGDGEMTAEAKDVRLYDLLDRAREESLKQKDDFSSELLKTLMDRQKDKT